MSKIVQTKGPLQKNGLLVQKIGHSRISVIRYNFLISYEIGKCNQKWANISLFCIKITQIKKTKSEMFVIFSSQIRESPFFLLFRGAKIVWKKPLQKRGANRPLAVLTRTFADGVSKTFDFQGHFSHFFNCSMANNAIKFYVQDFSESIPYVWAHEDLFFTTYRQTETSYKITKKFLTNIVGKIRSVPIILCPTRTS